ncbi:hypothetical protein M434DRAFT_402328, partial [Hypoxylon sp. CO27-5]
MLIFYFIFSTSRLILFLSPLTSSRATLSSEMPGQIPTQRLSLRRNFVPLAITSTVRPRLGHFCPGFVCTMNRFFIVQHDNRTGVSSTIDGWSSTVYP